MDGKGKNRAGIGRMEWRVPLTQGQGKRGYLEVERGDRDREIGTLTIFWTDLRP